MKMELQSFITILSAAFFATTISGMANAYDGGPVSNGGSIQGTITYKGNVPVKKIIPTKDVETCGEPRERPLIAVGDNHAVKDAAVHLVDVKKGKAWPAQTKPPELDNLKCRFVPDVSIIRAGPLDVVNSDPVLHNTHGYYGRRTAFNLALPNKDQRIPTSLRRSGTVRVDCDAHGWMEGWVYVVDNPYYALTGADGKFDITDVPPGTYKLVVDQAFIGPTEQTVKVEAGKATNLNIELKKK